MVSETASAWWAHCSSWPQEAGGELVVYSGNGSMYQHHLEELIRKSWRRQLGPLAPKGTEGSGQVLGEAVEGFDRLSLFLSPLPFLLMTQQRSALVPTASPV